MTLKELTIGDKFVNVKKPDEKWIVRGNPSFNARHGSPTRVCVKISDNTLHSKSCKIEVKKIGESVHKEKMIQSPVNFR
jgi:hypothetical protein